MTTARAPKKEKGLHIVELYVQNIMKVRVARIRPKGAVVQIAGKNGQGKTSVLRAIAWALTGTDDVPSEPIRKGERAGLIRIDLGDLLVTRYFTHLQGETKRGEKFITRIQVEPKNKSSVYKRPQEVLDALMGRISFDPLAFIRMKEAAQLEVLRGLVTFDVDIDELDKLQKADYEERRIAGREIESRKARLDAMPVPQAGLPDAPIDVDALTKKLETAANHNNMVAASRSKKLGFEEQAEVARSRAAEARQKALLFMDQATALDGRAYRLVVEEEASGQGEVQKLLELSANVAVGEEINTAEVAAELNAAVTTNRAIVHARQYADVAEELKEGEAYWEMLDARMKERAAERAAAIARAQMPIEGLSVGDGEVLYQGLPFGQASNAEQIRVSMALGMASNPHLKVLLIKDGSLLDADSMALVAAEAEKHSFQVWIERVDASGTVGVVMEDGEATGDEVVSK
jgi:hypothetical protein